MMYLSEEKKDIYEIIPVEIRSTYNKQAQLCFQHVSSYTSATEGKKVFQALKDLVCHRPQIESIWGQL